MVFRLVPLLVLLPWVVLVISLNTVHLSSLKYDHWTLFADFGSLCCFYANFLKHMWTVINYWNHEAKKRVLIVQMLVAAINLIAASSSLLRFVGWDGLCEDRLGFALPLTMWVEWLVCVPAMGFLATFTDEDDDQPHLDKLFIASLGTCILLGFGSTFVETVWAYALLLAGSYAAFFASAGIVASQATSHRGYQILDGANLDSTDVEATTVLRSVLNRSIKTKKLRRLLLFVLPPFPILHMLGTFHVLSLEWTYVGLCLANFGAKYMFMSNASELHMDLVERLVTQLNSERVLNESRRMHLRYVFHEVRVPLNSLSLGLNVLKDKEDLTDDERDALLMMQDSATFMADTLNDVLSMSQIEEGKMSLKLEKMCVREMLQRALSTLKGAAVGKGIELLPLVGMDVPAEVVADKFRLEHVVANLVSNAIKFSPSGSKIRINVKAKDVEKSIKDGKISPHLADFSIAVKDEGRGLSAEDIRNLFTPFQQIRPDAVQQRNGTGLGLSLARNIVRLHGGELTCESELGHGCTFTIRLPLEVLQTHVTEALSSLVSAEAQAHVVGAPVVEGSGAWGVGKSITSIVLSARSPGDGDDEEVNSIRSPSQHSAILQRPPEGAAGCTGANIVIGSNGLAVDTSICSSWRVTSTPIARGHTQALIIDDTSSNRKMLAMVLSKKNMTSVFAEDGLKGVEAVRAHPGHFDIIFMDNTMPIMTGVEATRVIRSEGFANLVIGVTGNALDDDVQAFLAAGADLVLAKPMRSAHLDALLAHMAVHGCGSSARKLKIVDDAIQFMEVEGGKFVST